MLLKSGSRPSALLQFDDKTSCAPCSKRVARARLARGFAGLGWIAMACAPQSAFADGVTSALYVRVDSDDTLVVSPRVHGSTHLGEATQFDATYAADVWTSASIDIRASASRAVTEQRNELDAAVSHDFGDLVLNGSYRYSIENDYESHGANLGGTLELADNASTLALTAFGFQDQVGRAGDRSFSRALATLGGRASFTQLFDSRMFGQLSYEVGSLRGYQASPYRFVGIGPGATGFGCTGAVQCFREHVPDDRLRHALAVLLRRALSTEFSVGVQYRLYFDDWQQVSHTVAADLGWLVGGNSLLTLSYRFYTQSGVYFYSKIYTTPADLAAYITRDREQSPMQGQRVGIDLENRSPLAEGGPKFVFNLRLGGVMYSYSAFVGLTRVYALEATLALGLEN